ncbi:MAG: hypothetical protein KatS3mg076_2955 [Candidatus Binatia bacterium]|nr:MAG: hypothetical protein KatS3mg076_2955 [Candidatus Binatia bacterium]
MKRPEKNILRSGLAALVLFGTQTLLAPESSRAETVLVKEEDGALFDAVIDGFPGLAPFDGTPDFGENPLAVALKSGVTEERGIAEFPLAKLLSTSPERIREATLVFNIDDVLSTFGPGTEFAGRAAREILVHTYAGDGAVELADYARVENEPVAVDTTVFGEITDRTLRASGPLRFEVDVTEALRGVLRDGHGFFGVLWRTEDSPTGTSLDNLGDGSAGPPGVGGSFLPFLSIEIAEDRRPRRRTATATPTATPTTPPNPTASFTRTPTRTYTRRPTPPPTATRTPRPSPTSPRPPSPTPGRTAPPPSPPDPNCDGRTNAADLVALVLAAPEPPNPPPGCRTDLTGDGRIDTRDVEIVLAHLFGR